MNCAKHREGGHADYYGITYERVDEHMGLFWPCPSLDHPGTPHLFEGGRSFHPDGKCRFVTTEWRESGDPVDEQYPVYLTTGRVVSQYLSGTQTRRLGGLVDIYPEPLAGNSPATRGAVWNCGWRRRHHRQLAARKSHYALW